MYYEGNDIYEVTYNAAYALFTQKDTMIKLNNFNNRNWAFYLKIEEKEKLNLYDKMWEFEDDNIVQYYRMAGEPRLISQIKLMIIMYSRIFKGMSDEDLWDLALNTLKQNGVNLSDRKNRKSLFSKVKSSIRREENFISIFNPNKYDRERISKNIEFLEKMIQDNHILSLYN